MLPLQPFRQESPEMKMDYAIVIRLGDQWCHGDDIFGIVVLDGMEITKLTLIGVIVGYHITKVSHL